MIGRRIVERALERKEFVRQEGRDHLLFIYVTLAGMKSSIRTMTSRGTGKADIGDPLISKMAKQCKLRKRDFERLIDCSLSREDYEKALIDNGSIDPKGTVE